MMVLSVMHLLNYHQELRVNAMDLSNWDEYKTEYFKSEAELIFWEILNNVFNEPIPRFSDLLERAINGHGYTVYEGLGYSLYNDNDESKEYPYVLIYCGDFTYQLKVNKFLNLLKYACNYYSLMHKESRLLIDNLYKKLTNSIGP